MGTCLSGKVPVGGACIARVRNIARPSFARIAFTEVVVVVIIRIALVR
jgi:hypothetical protein